MTHLQIFFLNNALHGILVENCAMSNSALMWNYLLNSFMHALHLSFTLKQIMKTQRTTTIFFFGYTNPLHVLQYMHESFFLPPAHQLLICPIYPLSLLCSKPSQPCLTNFVCKLFNLSCPSDVIISNPVPPSRSQWNSEHFSQLFVSPQHVIQKLIIVLSYSVLKPSGFIMSCCDFSIQTQLLWHMWLW